MEKPVQKRVPESPCADAAQVKIFDAHSFTVPVTKFVKHEKEKKLFHRAKMEQLFVKMAEAIMETKIKVEDAVPTKMIDAARSPSP